MRAVATNSQMTVLIGGVPLVSMKTQIVLVLLAFTTILCGNSAAQSTPTSDKPAFAAGWRVTGVLRQGGKVQASLENATRRFAKFVSEGDELMDEIVVEKIDRQNRCVTLRRGTETVVIRAGSAPIPAVASAAPAKTQAKPDQPRRVRPWEGGPSKAEKDPSGQWGVRGGNGEFFSAQDYVNRFGGIEKAFEHSKKHLSEDTDANRISFHQQMLGALKKARRNLSEPQARN